MWMRCKFWEIAVVFDGHRGPDLISISAHKIHGLKGTGLQLWQATSYRAISSWWKQEFGLRSGT